LDIRCGKGTFNSQATADTKVAIDADIAITTQRHYGDIGYAAKAIVRSRRTGDINIQLASPTYPRLKCANEEARAIGILDASDWRSLKLQDVRGFDVDSGADAQDTGGACIEE
jgi:hypothetical protein